MFRTEVSIQSPTKQISYGERLLFMGSCFADNLGSRLQTLNFNVLVNPFGVLYNPSSIAKSLYRLLEPAPYCEEDVCYHNELWQSFDHHGDFNKTDKITCLHGINDTLASGASFLSSCDVLFITFGTAYVYKHKTSGQVVANCHRWPASTFTRELLSVDTIVEDYIELILKLNALRPSLQIVLTLSPVRHWKDGANGNQVSKAKLLLAIHELVNAHANVSYFPAYELMLDELRDYRFYADDMLHPSSLAIDFIQQRLMNAWFDGQANQFARQMEQIKKDLSHRPFNNTSEAYLKFLKSIKQKIQHVKDLYPLVCLDDKVEQVRIGEEKNA